MLVLTRKANQSIMIGDQIEVSVLSVLGEKVRLGIQAPRDVPVFRKEVFLEIQAQNIQAADASREALDQALGMMGEADAAAPAEEPGASPPDEESNDATG